MSIVALYIGDNNIVLIIIPAFVHCMLASFVLCNQYSEILLLVSIGGPKEQPEGS